jgi:hypothetical protein
MQTRETYVVERELGGQGRDCPFPVARGALPLGMATCAQVPLTRRTRSVLADPVAVVHQVIVGRLSLRWEIDVAPVAVAQSPLIAMLVAPEAGRHLRKDGIGAGLGDFDVTPHAVAAGRRHVLRVIESQLGPRKLDAAAHVRFAVAPHARPFVVGLLVAPHTVRGRGKMERTVAAGGLDSHVAHDAVDPLEHVRAMLERVRRRFAANPEHAGAGRSEDDE